MTSEESYENHQLDRPVFAGVAIHRLWTEWFSRFPEHGTDAHGFGGPVYGRAHTVALLLGGGGATGDRRPAVAGEALRAARSRASWTSDCEHTAVSHIPESGWYRDGDRCDSAVAHSLLR